MGHNNPPTTQSRTSHSQHQLSILNQHPEPKADLVNHEFKIITQEAASVSKQWHSPTGNKTEIALRIRHAGRSVRRRVKSFRPRVRSGMLGVPFRLRYNAFFAVTCYFLL